MYKNQFTLTIFDLNQDFQKLFNFHIDLHFDRIVSKYNVFWNVNVFFKKNKHRFYKQIVLFINHRKSKKQLFFKETMRFIIKILMYEVFLHINFNMTSQFLRLRKQCSSFFESLLFLMNRDVENKNYTNIFLLKSITHTQLSVREKLTQVYMKHHSLSITMSSSNETFCQMMQIVMKAYNV